MVEAAMINGKPFSGLLSSLNSIPVYESPLAVFKKQYRFPRTKRRRIQKKWAKRDENFKFLPAAFMIEDGFGDLLGIGYGKTLVLHPSFKRVLENEIKLRNEVYERKWR